MKLRRLLSMAGVLLFLFVAWLAYFMSDRANQREWIEQALHARDESTRITAVKMIADQAILSQIALGNDTPALRQIAVERLTERGALVTIAKRPDAYYKSLDEWMVTQAAVSRLHKLWGPIIEELTPTHTITVDQCKAQGGIIKGGFCY
jgi:hypothetical protein